jgi:hypothetical protein
VARFIKQDGQNIIMIRNSYRTSPQRFRRDLNYYLNKEENYHRTAFKNDQIYEYIFYN